MQTIQELFGARCRHLRKTRTKLSMDDFALGAGLDPSGYARIERGKGNPRLDVVEKIARGLGVHPRLLFQFEWE